MKRETIRQLMEKCGLAPHADLILPFERPCVWLSLKCPGQGEVGSSRVGGLPDLPQGAAWPLTSSREPMDFAMQINLSQLPAGQHWPLPRAGWLLIFVGLDEPATDIEHHVMVVPPHETLRPRALPDGEIANEMFREIEPYQLELTYAPDFPRWASNDFSMLEEQMGEVPSAYDRLFLDGLCPIDRKMVVAKLFGHVAGTGHDPREDAVVVKAYSRKWLYDYEQRATLDLSQAHSWQPLVTIESCMDLDLCIWDAGFLQILIESDRLLKADFSNCYAAVESS